MISDLTHTQIAESQINTEQKLPSSLSECELFQKGKLCSASTCSASSCGSASASLPDPRRQQAAASRPAPGTGSGRRQPLAGPDNLGLGQVTHSLTHFAGKNKGQGRHLALKMK